MRQTDLSFEELKSELVSLKLCSKKCFVINEIGCCLIEEGQKEAEPVLRSLLKSDSEDDRAPAFAYLLSAKELSKETLKAMQIFKKKVENAKVVQWAEKEVQGKMVN